MPDFVRRFGVENPDGTFTLDSSRQSIITSLLSAGYVSLCVCLLSWTCVDPRFYWTRLSVHSLVLSGKLSHPTASGVAAPSLFGQRYSRSAPRSKPAPSTPLRRSLSAASLPAWVWVPCQVRLLRPVQPLRRIDVRTGTQLSYRSTTERQLPRRCVECYSCCISSRLLLGTFPCG